MKKHLIALREVARELRKNRYASTETVSKIINVSSALVEFDETHIHVPKEHKKTELVYDNDFILKSVCKIFECTENQVKGRSRFEEILQARHLVVYILRTENGLSFWHCGDFVNRSHANAMNSCNKVRQYETERKDFKFKKEQVYELLKITK